MALELGTRSNELGEILRVVDESVRGLNHLSTEKGQGLIQHISEQVEWSLEELLDKNLLHEHSQLHEVISYLDLACFSLLQLDGDSFPIYLEELNQKYKILLRKLYLSYRHM